MNRYKQLNFLLK